MISRVAFQPQPLCGSVAWNGILAKKGLQNQLARMSEILLLRGLHVVEDKGNGVLILVSKSSVGSEAQSRKAFLFVCDCLCTEMFQLFSKNCTQHLCLLCFCFFGQMGCNVQGICNESVERSKEEGEVAGKNMVKGKENNARGKIFMINSNPQSEGWC